jgi:hypothetical protein
MASMGRAREEEGSTRMMAETLVDGKKGRKERKQTGSRGDSGRWREMSAV